MALVAPLGQSLSLYVVRNPCTIPLSPAQNSEWIAYVIRTIALADLILPQDLGILRERLIDRDKDARNCQLPSEKKNPKICLSSYRFCDYFHFTTPRKGPRQKLMFFPQNIFNIA